MLWSSSVPSAKVAWHLALYAERGVPPVSLICVLKPEIASSSLVSAAGKVQTAAVMALPAA